MQGGMEPEMKDYLRKVLNTLFVGLLWLILNATLGIFFGFAFTDGKIRLSNVLFYLWFLASLSAMLWHFYRLWRKDF
jgi:ABC-type glycerol-3-phosphate transport system permease component